jgi:hypothetical protein
MTNKFLTSLHETESELRSESDIRESTILYRQGGSTVTSCVQLFSHCDKGHKLRNNLIVRKLKMVLEHHQIAQ